MRMPASAKNAKTSAAVVPYVPATATGVVNQKHPQEAQRNTTGECTAAIPNPLTVSATWNDGNQLVTTDVTYNFTGCSFPGDATDAPIQMFHLRR